LKTFTRLFVFALLLGAYPATADDQARLAIGGDQFAAGQLAALTTPVQHDAFAIGSDVTLATTVAGDAHLAGYDVDVSADVTGDVYAAGFSVNVTAGIGGDLSALGNTVTLRSAAPLAGNARLAGAMVTIAAPVGGAALVSARSLTLDTVVSGDLSFYGENLTFGPGARVDGMLDIRAPQQIAVPASVAPADRVRFELLQSPDYVSEAGRTAGDVVGRFWPVFWTIAIWWLLLFAVGAGLIALLPDAVSALRLASQTRPWRNLGLGTLGLAAVLGLVPVVAMTIVGIVLLPIVLLFVIMACSLAYLTGSFLIGLRIAGAFVAVDSNLSQLGVLALALLAAALLGMIPFLGWLITLAIVIFGFGSASIPIMRRWSSGGAARPARQTTKPTGALG
jgi:hypothetical protein